MRVAVQERAGSALKHLTKSEPLEVKGCRRKDCFICKSDGAGNCEKNASGYEIRCETCTRSEKLSCYDGETALRVYRFRIPSSIKEAHKNMTNL